MATINSTDKMNQVAEYLLKLLQVNCPKDTTNLSQNINIQYVEDGKARIVIGHEKADYAVYTNEPWTSERWNGKTNPNEGWVNRTIEESAPIIQQIMSGQISEEDFNQMITDLENEFDAQVQERLDEIDRKLNMLKNNNT